MKISSDNDSWHVGGVIRRDFRHDHGVDEVSRHKGSKTKKSVLVCKSGKGHRFRSTGWSSKCSFCGASYWKYSKELNKITQKNKKRNNKLQHKKDGIDTHLYVWELVNTMQRCECDIASYYYCQVHYNHSFYSRERRIRDAFRAGKKIVQYDKICISCGHVDKSKYLVENENIEDYI